MFLRRRNISILVPHRYIIIHRQQRQASMLKTYEFKPHPSIEKPLVAVDSFVPLPAIIALQEWWGINDQIKSHAQRIANGTGAVVVVPDLYDGKLGLNAEEASHLMSNLDWKNSIERLESLVDSLRNESSHLPSSSTTNVRKVGCIGFCMGSALALALAARCIQKKPHPLNAVVGFYGIPSQDLTESLGGIDIASIPLKTPVQAHFGKLDSHLGFSDIKTAKKLEQDWENVVKKSGGRHSEGFHKEEFDVFFYDDYGHAFMNDDDFSRDQRKKLNMAGEYNSEFANQVWTGVFKFFTKHLKSI